MVRVTAYPRKREEGLVRRRTVGEAEATTAPVGQQQLLTTPRRLGGVRSC